MPVVRYVLDKNGEARKVRVTHLKKWLVDKNKSTRYIPRVGKRVLYSSVERITVRPTTEVVQRETTVPTQSDREAQLLSMETSLRVSLVSALSIPMELADKIRISYSEEDGLWIINGYKSAKQNHDFPLEAKLTYQDGRWNIISMDFRGRERTDWGLMILRSLNGE
jgi:hypothetical protein